MRNRMMALLLGFGMLFGASAGQALSISGANLGGDKACDSLACNTQTHSFTSSSGTGGGTISLSGTTLTFDITVDGSFFTGIGGGGLDTTFGSTQYLGSATVSILGPLVTVLFGSATIDGSASSSAGGNPFTQAAASVGGQCTTLGGSLSCGLIFSFGDNADLNAVAGVSPTYFFHTVNLNAPEPGLAGLLVLGLVGIAGLRRR